AAVRSPVEGRVLGAGGAAVAVPLADGGVAGRGRRYRVLRGGVTQVAAGVHHQAAGRGGRGGGGGRHYPQPGRAQQDRERDGPSFHVFSLLVGLGMRPTVGRAVQERIPETWEL